MFVTVTYMYGRCILVIVTSEDCPFSNIHLPLPLVLLLLRHRRPSHDLEFPVQSLHRTPCGYWPRFTLCRTAASGTSARQARPQDHCLEASHTTGRIHVPFASDNLRYQTTYCELDVGPTCEKTSTEQGLHWVGAKLLLTLGQ